ncbi:MAG TPA: DEAD/DEAH box helicase [Rhodospirillales bacterium]|nr:DEAD/DEAH box helicase [Rhodospirillales bacterium]
MAFADLQLSEGVLRAVTDSGYSEPTPIQREAIPYIFMGRDILGCAQTGTGKTASFTLPMIDILAAGRARARMPRSLILEPTRELAAQVAENFDTYGKYHKLAKALLIGGESMNDQIRVLERGADVLIATPGRLIDVFDRGYLLLNDVKILVIDEADRMLDMGFIPDVERIVSVVSRNRQTLLFSATMPPAIRKLADAFLSNPKEIVTAPPSTPAENVVQELIVVNGDGTHKTKRAALRSLIDTEEVKNALIFCNRKRDVGIVCRSLTRHGYDASMLHGDMAQPARTQVLESFRRGEITLLVCSDVAARGLDIQDMSHVLNFDVPSSPEDYVHRIGRTGRAGRAGRALSIALPEDGVYVHDIEALIGHEIPRRALEGFEPAELTTAAQRRRRGKPAPRSGGSAQARGQSSRPRAQERPAASAPPRPAPAAKTTVEAEQAAPAAPAGPAAPPRNNNRRGERRAPRQNRENERTVVGMGDHVPAFLLREPTISSKS